MDVSVNPSEPKSPVQWERSRTGASTLSGERPFRAVGEKRHFLSTLCSRSDDGGRQDESHPRKKNTLLWFTQADYTKRRREAAFRWIPLLRYVNPDLSKYIRFPPSFKLCFFSFPVWLFVDPAESRCVFLLRRFLLFAPRRLIVGRYRRVGGRKGASG